MPQYTLPIGSTVTVPGWTRSAANDPTTPTEAPGQRYRCACVHFDARACLQGRYGYDNCGGARETCGCICHEADQDEED